MRISFDLDDVLFVSPDRYETEPALHFPFNRLFPDRLRKGTPQLIHDLQHAGFEVWVYTSSFRTESYIRRLFKHYHIKFDGIVNGTRHMKEVQRDNKQMLPQKLPNRYRISLHIDDEAIVCTLGKQYGYNVFQLNAQDDDWKEKVIACADKIRKRDFEE